MISHFQAVPREIEEAAVIDGCGLFETDAIPPATIVFDAIVMPEQTKLLAVAEASRCRVVRGREMMRGQIARMVEFFGIPERKEHA